ncbi:uncharacterized protein LOC120195555 [Hibiscus syriacus]|uniref:uncharacterized protein LOC120195555 n=1 Tax=Hibiscus syriacus TaxID=106335 RepID=UPI001920EBF8|nr:uncharacterized protein LOC120195555 [Hibiscus syriacus]
MRVHTSAERAWKTCWPVGVVGRDAWVVDRHGKQLAVGYCLQPRGLHVGCSGVLADRYGLPWEPSMWEAAVGRRAFTWVALGCGADLNRVTHGPCNRVSAGLGCN